MNEEELQEKRNKARAGIMGTLDISTKIAIMVVVFLGINTFLCIFVSRNSYSTRVQDVIREDMIATATSYGKSTGNLIQMLGDQPTADQLGALVGDAVIPNDSSGYIYIVSEDGTMLYHPTPEKIGEPVENDAVKSLVSSLKAGSIPAPDVIKYVFKGQDKYAGYYITNDAGIKDIIVVSADLGKITSEAVSIPTDVIVLSLVTALIIAILSFIFVRLFLRPITHLNTSLEKIAGLDFTQDADLEKYYGWKNETGDLARHTITMSDSIDKVTVGIRDAVDDITDHSARVRQAMSEISDASTDNSATTQELAAGMEEATSTTQSIADNMEMIVEKSDEVSRLATEGMELSKEIYRRAAAGSENAANAKAKAEVVFVDIKKKTTVALEEAKSIDKINSLTETIRGIASQTNLLSLNASIEAARAGEMGKGFAVVASEIGALANQSTETVGQINEIVSEIKVAVNGMADSLTEVMNFAETSSDENLGMIESISGSYSDDTASFESILNQMKHSMDELSDNISNVNRSISGMNDTINESSRAISDVAVKTDEIVSKTTSAMELIGETTEHSESLHNVLSAFKL